MQYSLERLGPNVGELALLHITVVSARPMRILLLDDDLGVRTAYSRLLIRAGFEVVTFADGADAMESFEPDTFEAGVETVEERDAMSQIGCDWLQGYLFGKPARGFAPPQL